MAGEPTLGDVADADAIDADENPLLSLAQGVVALRGKPLLVWVQHGGPSREEMIDDLCVARLREAFRGIEQLPELDVLLHSGGGYAESAYRALRILRRHAKKLTLLVPYWAKSAATLLTLGADEVLMGQDGELGPLDAQITDPKGSLFPLSALEEFKAMESVREFALDTLDDLVVQLCNRSGMDIPYALDRAQMTIRDFTAPLYGQVRPHDLGRYRRSLAVAEEYGKRAMRRWGYPSISQTRIDRTVHALVWDYPAHDFVIDLEEARGLHLNASPMASELDDIASRVIDVGQPALILVGVPHPGEATDGTVSAATPDEEDEQEHDDEENDGDEPRHGLAAAYPLSAEGNGRARDGAGEGREVGKEAGQQLPGVAQEGPV